MDKLMIPGNIFMTSSSEFRTLLLDILKKEDVVVFMTLSSARRLSLDALVNDNSLLWIKEIPSNPTYKDICIALRKIGRKEYKLIVAIGGGSTIDMAKACVALNYLNDKNNLYETDILEALKSKEYLNHPSTIPIHAVPTTAGTGSEVTRWATIWDMNSSAKYSVDAPCLYPEKVYIIPEFTASMPERLTLSTGLDALCQAVEAYWAKATNPMVKELSKTAISLIIEYLPKVIEEPADLHYREKALLGSLFSGLAFSITRTTACHSISYPLTMKFGIEHGFACIISLPAVMKINFRAIEESEELLRALRIRDVDDLQVWLDKISEGVINLRLSSFGIKNSDIDELVEMSFTLGRMDNNPVEINKEDVRRILESML